MRVLRAVALTVSLTAAPLAAATAGTLTPVDPAAFGSGPLAMSQYVKAYAEVYYAKLKSPDFLLVSKDGDSAVTVWCADGPGSCGPPSPEYQAALRACQRHASTKCYMHSKGHYQVWRGAVTVKEGDDISVALANVLEQQGMKDGHEPRVSIHGSQITFHR